MHEKMVTASVIREIQIKAAVGKQNKLFRKAKIKKTDNIKCQRGCRAARTCLINGSPFQKLVRLL